MVDYFISPAINFHCCSYDSKIGILGIPISVDPVAASTIGDRDIDDPPYHDNQQFGVSLGL